MTAIVNDLGDKRAGSAINHSLRRVNLLGVNLLGGPHAADSTTVLTLWPSVMAESVGPGSGVQSTRSALLDAMQGA